MRVAIFIISLFYSVNLFSNDIVTQEIIIKDHRFHPSKIDLPASRKIELVINNQDSTIEEFESFDLKREKIIPANGKKIIKIGPLKEGQYKFFGEFHESTAQGVINIKE